jgi:outer membrane protein OmpA-like peptidoglycan-associated protein
MIQAHVAEGDGEAAALELTRRRAAAVRASLVGAGVAGTRLSAYGCGQALPIAPNNVPWGRKKNERVELRLLDPAPASGIPSIKGCKISE